MKKLLKYFYFRTSFYGAAGLIFYYSFPLLRIIQAVFYPDDDFVNLIIAVAFGALILFFWIFVITPEYLILKKGNVLDKDFDIRAAFDKTQLYGKIRKVVIFNIFSVIVSELAIAIKHVVFESYVFTDYSLLPFISFFIYTGTVAVVLSIMLQIKAKTKS